MRESLPWLRSARFELSTREDVAAVAANLARDFPEYPWIELVLAELMLNAVEHGNLGIGGELKSELVRAGALEAEVGRRAEDPRYRDRRAWLTVEHERSGALRFVVGDEGEGFDWRHQNELSMTRPCGRGLRIASALAPYGLEFNQEGNVILVRAKP